MKISFFSDSGPPFIGGGQRYVQNLGTELVRNGFEVHWMYTKLQNTKKEQVIDGINCHRINVPFGRTFFPIASIPKVYKLAKSSDISQFDTFYSGLSGWIPGKLSKKPYLLTVYEFFQELWDIMAKNKVESFFYKTAEKYLANSPYQMFITISEYTKKRMVNLGCDKKKIRVVYPGIDNKLFHPDYEKSIKTDKFVIGWTGRMNLSQSKNLPMLLDAFKIVKSKNDNVVLALNGPDFDKLESTIKEKGLVIGKDVIYNGCVEQNKLPNFYCSMDLYVSSSLSEGFGFSVAEAEACGVPVVCFDAGALSEVVYDGKTGLIVKEKTSQSLADGILKMIEEDNLKEYGKNAVKWTEQFNWENTAKQNLEIYKEIM